MAQPSLLTASYRRSFTVKSMDVAVAHQMFTTTAKVKSAVVMAKLLTTMRHAQWTSSKLRIDNKIFKYFYFSNNFFLFCISGFI